MNRKNFTSNDKITKPLKPVFVKQEFNRGDRVSNMEIIYTPDGYFEIGCEFMYNGYYDNSKAVLRHIGENGEIGNKDIRTTFCFKVVDKDWVNKI